VRKPRNFLADTVSNVTRCFNYGLLFRLVQITLLPTLFYCFWSARGLTKSLETAVFDWVMSLVSLFVLFVYLFCIATPLNATIEDYQDYKNLRVYGALYAHTSYKGKKHLGIVVRNDIFFRAIIKTVAASAVAILYFHPWDAAAIMIIIYIMHFLMVFCYSCFVRRLYSNTIAVLKMMIFNGGMVYSWWNAAILSGTFVFFAKKIDSNKFESKSQAETFVITNISIIAILLFLTFLEIIFYGDCLCKFARELCHSICSGVCALLCC
jgi:hypothetical protein